jgi:ABC-type branched-subunit amino acid transport system ATPase component
MTALEVAQYGFVVDRGRVIQSEPTAVLAADDSIPAAYWGQ